MTIYCLNPDCPDPINDDLNKFCASCKASLLPLLRNRFRVIRVLSQEGGFGKTYLAQDSDKLNEPCVIKQLAPRVEESWALKKAVDLFEKEAKLLQELGEHPQIPKLLAYFEQDNCLYLVQQFINGQNLLQELEARRKEDIWLRCYSEKEIRDFLLNLLPVLEFIHERGVVHRDIKPQNIIRCNSPQELMGDLVLIDFGSSKELTPKIELNIGTSIGSHGYSPIEQIRDGLAYPASDLFSVGATCFHLITGISPFQLWMEHGYGWMNTWEKYLNYPISDELANILDKLLKKDIEERYQSASAVIADLKLPQKYPVVLPPPIYASEQLVPPTEVPSIPRKHLKLKSLLMAGVAITMFFVGEIWYWKTREAQIHNPETQPSIQPAAKTDKVWNQPGSRRQFVLAATLNLIYDSVSSLAIAPDSKTLVSNSIFGVKLWSLLAKQEISVFNAHNLKVNVVAINPDGSRFVSAGDDKTIKVWNLGTGQEIRTLKGHTGSIYALAFSPDGKILASSGNDSSIKLWNFSSGKQIASFDRHNARVTSLAFDATGKMLASASVDGSIKIWDTKSQTLVMTIPGKSNRASQVAFIKNPGRKNNNLLIGSYNNNIRVWNPTTGNQIRVFTGHSQPVTSIAVNYRANLLASGSGDKTIKLWNLSNGELLNTLEGHSSKVESITFSKDGNILVSCAGDRKIKIWQISNF